MKIKIAEASALTLAERGMLAHLTDLGANTKRTIDVPYAGVATTYGVSDRTVSNYMRRLVEHGLIHVQVGTGRTPTRVRLTK